MLQTDVSRIGGQSALQDPGRLFAGRWVGVLAIVGSLLLIGCNLTSDAKLKSVFYANRNDFAKLLNMSRQDFRVTTIKFDITALDNDDSWPRKDIGLSEQRWDEYRQVFRKLGLKDGISRRKDLASALFLYAKCTGSAVDMDCKGYVYSEVPLAPVRNNLDNLAPGLAFEHLSANWYLFRDGE